jgi:UDP-glucuronate decarboxylase
VGLTPLSRLSFSSSVNQQLLDSGATVVITGARGWLGRATVEMLESVFDGDTESRLRLFGSTKGQLDLRSGRRLPVQPLGELATLHVGAHLFAHFAFATREQVSVLGFSDYTRRNRLVSNCVASHLARNTTAGLLYISSGAVYSGADLAENPYGVLKAEDERLFSELAASSTCRTRLVIPRLFNLSGPFLNKTDRYVLGSIIDDIGRGGPIRLSASSPVIRSYVHVADLVDLSFAVMLGEAPAPAGPFDTAGEREIEVSELAEIAARVLGHPGMSIERPALGSGDADRYVGDGSTMRGLAHAYGLNLKSLETQIEDTARFLTE